MHRTRALPVLGTVLLSAVVSMPVHAAAPWTPGWSWSVEPEYGRPRLDVDMHIAGGGSGNVFVNGKPLARSGDLTTGCTGK